jgi:hypothetical protein
MALILLLSSCAGLLSSCAGDPQTSDARSMLPSKVGASGEVVVVADAATWAAVQPVIEQALQGPVSVLPQFEPQFDIEHLTPSELSRFWKPHRNLVIFDVADRIDTQEPSMLIGKEKYSRGQIYARIKATTPDAAADIFSSRAVELADLLERTEVKRFLQLTNLRSNEALEKRLLHAHGLQSVIPRDAVLVEETPEFLWIQRSLTRLKGNNNHDVQMGIFITRAPYTGPEMFSLAGMLARRDSVLRERVGGEVPGSFMATEYRRTPRYEEIAFHGGFAATLRGLWKMEGDFMGGPFTAIAWLDPFTNELVTVDGFAYAPYFSKREYLREIEGIAHSFLPVDRGEIGIDIIDKQ